MRGDGSAANQVDIITGCPSCVGGGSGEEVATSDGNTGNCGLAPATHQSHSYPPQGHD